MADAGLIGQQFLATQQEAQWGRPVTISDGAHSVTVTAIVGHTLFKQTDTQGRLRMHHGDRDYLIRPEVIVLNGVVTVPTPGLTIVDSVDGDTYTVTSPGGEPCYRKSDPYGVRLRIHCKQTG